MGCRKTWSKDFLVENLNISWVQKEYKNHRKKLLLDREISKIPDTIPVAERELICQEIHVESENIRGERLKLEAQSRALKYKEQQCHRRIHDIRNHKDDGAQRRKFIMPCQNDDCRGFISNSYKCELCKMFTCSKCHELLGPEKECNHVCKEENVKSVETIRQNTKPCPKCGTRIQKIDGCDQMWCPQDHVAFSWRTGQIDTGCVHNPHYYEFQRRVNNGQVPRNHGDNPCNQICSMHELRQINVKIKMGIEKKMNMKLTDMSDNVLVLSLDRIQKWFTNLWWIVQQTFRNKEFVGRQVVTSFDHNLTKIRVQYINKGISKDMMADSIIKLDKMRAKEQAKIQIYSLIMEVTKEHFNTLVDFRHQQSLTVITEGVRDFCCNIQSILIYFNEEMRKISVSHNTLVEQIISRTSEQVHPRRIWISNMRFNKKTINDECDIDRKFLLHDCDMMCAQFK